LHFERAFYLETDELKQLLVLPDLAKAAVEADVRDKARIYATKLLEKAADPECFQPANGRAVHYGNLVLGRLAIQGGDLEGAKRHLLRSARTAGDPALCTGGPNMSLAKELLDRGERRAVIEYLHLCGEFWETNDHRAEQWAYAIAQGQVPDFGPNLDY